MSINIAILGATFNERINDVQNKLVLTNLFENVDIVDVQNSTPSLSSIINYDSIITFSDQAYFNSEDLGNLIADYIDSGKGVITCVFELALVSFLQGRWELEGYSPLYRELQSGGNGLHLGKVFIPNHPIMNEVKTFNGGGQSIHGPGEPTAYTSVIAEWSNEYPLILEKFKKTNGSPISGRCIGLNFFPPSEDGFDGGWLSNTDGAKIMGNALLYESKKNDIKLTCSNKICENSNFKCYVGKSNSCSCSQWKFLYPQCTRSNYVNGLCQGSGAYVPAITVCNQKLF